MPRQILAPGGTGPQSGMVEWRGWADSLEQEYVHCGLRYFKKGKQPYS